MKTGILITARLGSTRLIEKHLKEVQGHPIIFYLIERIKHEFETEINNQEIAVYITTSDETENRALETVSSNVNVFYGSINNIPLRHLQTAYKHELDYIISVDGDDILCSVRGMRAVYNSLIQGADYVKTTGLPLGMNSAGYSTTFLQRCLDECNLNILETGWGRIFDNSMLQELPIKITCNNVRLRFTLDYKEDFCFFEQLITSLGSRVIKAHDDEIIEMVISKELYRLNESVEEEYWRNFQKAMEKEGENIES
jgi:spore coat polysaccharide biosynthesis protein SpsF